MVLPDLKESPELLQILKLREEAMALLDTIKDNPRFTLAQKQLDKFLVDLYILFSEYLKPNRRHSTLQAIGLWLGISRQRVAQIEQKAIGKLKHPSLRKFWDEIREARAWHEKEKIMEREGFQNEY